MSRLIFEEEYIIVVPSFSDVKPHRHDFYHLFFWRRKTGRRSELSKDLSSGTSEGT